MSYLNLCQRNLMKYIYLKSTFIYLTSLLKCVWIVFKIVLRLYVILKTLNFMHMNSPGSFHPTSDWSRPNFRFVTYGTDLVKYWKRCFIKQVKASELHIFYSIIKNSSATPASTTAKTQKRASQNHVKPPIRKNWLIGDKAKGQNSKRR